MLHEKQTMERRRPNAPVSPMKDAPLTSFDASLPKRNVGVSCIFTGVVVSSLITRLFRSDTRHESWRTRRSTELDNVLTSWVCRAPSRRLSRRHWQCARRPLTSAMLSQTWMPHFCCRSLWQRSVKFKNFAATRLRLFNQENQSHLQTKLCFMRLCPGTSLLQLHTVCCCPPATTHCVLLSTCNYTLCVVVHIWYSWVCCKIYIVDHHSFSGRTA